MSLLQRVHQRLARDFVLGNPTGDPGAQLSMIHPVDVGPSARLLDLSATAIRYARGESLSDISRRMPAPPRWPDIWPGEHYRLLAGLVRAMAALRIVEIGTYQGLSALSLARNLPEGGRLVTFDVVPCAQVPGNVLTPEDMESGDIRQEIADLADPQAAESHRETLEAADLIFVDAAKDGRMERAFLANFARMRFTRAPIIVFDDIRVWNMLAIWREIRRPKLDLTSFGHYSGTGLVDWNGAGGP